MCSRGHTTPFLARSAVKRNDRFVVRASASCVPFLACLALGCGAAALPEAAPSNEWPPRAVEPAPDPWSAAAVDFAHAQVGKRYCWGGSGPNCYDCSGLVQAAWRWSGVRLPRTSGAIGRALVDVAPVEVRP